MLLFFETEGDKFDVSGVAVDEFSSDAIALACIDLGAQRYTHKWHFSMVFVATIIDVDQHGRTRPHP